MPETTLVMTGRLEDFHLADVLQVVGLSRQYTSIELRRTDGRLFGTIWIKAGRVISAQRETVHGRSAFYDMFGPAPEVFIVSRLPEPTAYSAPLGSLANLVVEAIERGKQALAASPPQAPAAVARGTHVGTPPRKPPQSRTPPLRPVSMPMAGVAMATAAPTTSPSLPPPMAVVAPAAPVPPARRAAGSSPPQTVASLRSGPVTPPPLQAVDQEWDEALRIAKDAGTGIALAIASPKGGVGKTTITLNLALAVAQRGRRTIVIDADVNGDLLSLLAARDQVERGAYDILDKPESIDEVLRDTAVAGLRILPASGPPLPASATGRASVAAEWRALILQARQRADLVLVDCPAGMFGATADVLSACTHVVGVVQSDMIATRSSTMLERGLLAIPVEHRPRLVGVVVNMFQGRLPASLEAFHHISSSHSVQTLFETTIPRSDAFAAASLAGVPLRFAEVAGRRSPIAWLFEMLAAEVCDRTGLSETPPPMPVRFLL